MKLQFDANQKFHLDAIDAVLDFFVGQSAGKLKVPGTFFDELCLIMTGFDREQRVG